MKNLNYDPRFLINVIQRIERVKNFFAIDTAKKQPTDKFKWRFVHFLFQSSKKTVTKDLYCKDSLKI